MLCDKILGNVKNMQTEKQSVDYVDFYWDEAFKKVHKKVSQKGTEVGIRLDDSILTRGIRTGDILFEEETQILAARILPCQVIEIRIDRDHPKMTAKVCYEIGNRHAALFWGEDGESFLTPYTQPMLKMLEKLHGVKAQVKEAQLDFDARISASVNAHTH